MKIILLFSSVLFTSTIFAQSIINFHQNQNILNPGMVGVDNNNSLSGILGYEFSRDQMFPSGYYAHQPFLAFNWNQSVLDNKGALGVVLQSRYHQSNLFETNSNFVDVTYNHQVWGNNGRRVLLGTSLRMGGYWMKNNQVQPIDTCGIFMSTPAINVTYAGKNLYAGSSTNIHFNSTNESSTFSLSQNLTLGYKFRLGENWKFDISAQGVAYSLDDPSEARYYYSSRFGINAQYKRLSLTTSVSRGILGVGVGYKFNDQFSLNLGSSYYKRYDYQYFNNQLGFRWNLGKP